MSEHSDDRRTPARGVPARPPAGASPRVSVVVPVYNRESIVVETLVSVLDQSFGELELIVVDDGSTDGTRAVVTDFASRHPRVRVESQANGGVAAARLAHTGRHRVVR